MTYPLSARKVSRRQFLQYSALAGAGLAGLPFVSGCVTDPVSGKSQVMLVSEQQEIAIDRQQSPFQISSDYGICRDESLNRYVADVGKDLLPGVHRPGMPYRFVCVNAIYINAYAFPGGTVALTRGILLKLDNEAELAALLGHELGHVNARHTARQVSKAQLSSLLVGGLAVAAGTRSSGLGELTQQLGALGQGLFLSSYSRDNEREADALGNEYMVRAGYPATGFVGLMKMLDSLNRARPGAAATLFSTHPMSSERLDAAIQREKAEYRHTLDRPLNRDRYMDGIASLRANRQAIELLQEGESLIAKKEYARAEAPIKKSIDLYPDDYAAHVIMARCLLIQKKASQALAYADKAQKQYPAETQGHYVAGFARMELKRFSEAHRDFVRCDDLLPGNPVIAFFRGYCLEQTQARDPAAAQYMRYLKMVNYQNNPYSQHAHTRLREWGYIR